MSGALRGLCELGLVLGEPAEEHGAVSGSDVGGPQKRRELADLDVEQRRSARVPARRPRIEYDRLVQPELE